MIDILSRKTTGGDLCINLARHHLKMHEWGLAKKAAEEGLARGQLSEPDKANALLRDICSRLSIDKFECKLG